MNNPILWNAFRLVENCLVLAERKLLFPCFSAGVGHILLFHRVVKNNEVCIGRQSEWEVTQDRLERIIHFYRAENYEFISIDEMYNRIAGRKPGNRFVVFTFDDGCKSFMELAYPALRKHNVPAIVYIISNFMLKNTIKWEDHLGAVIETNNHITLMSDQVVEHCRSKGDTRRASHEQALADFTGLNTPLGISSIKQWLRNHRHSCSKGPNMQFLSSEDVKLLSSDKLITIGAHSANHLVLSRLTKNDLWEEFVTSKQVLEEVIDGPVDHFAYPYGGRTHVGIREREFARRAKYKTASSTRPGNLTFGHNECFYDLPRFNVNEKSNPYALYSICRGIRSGCYKFVDRVRSNWELLLNTNTDGHI